MKKKQSFINSWFFIHYKITGVLIFSLVFAILLLTIYFRFQVIKKNQQSEMANMLGIAYQNINHSLKNSYATAIGIALTIDDNGVPKNFDQVGKQLLSINNAIDAVQLVPQGIIRYTYPLKGNEAATNLNILKSPLHREAALKAIEKRKMYYVGPMTLKQGGLGVVGRLPVFKKGKFWGFSAVVVKFPKFIKSAGIENFNSNRFYFQLSKWNPKKNKEDFFLEGSSDLKNKAYKVVSIPEGDWKLYIIQKENNFILKQALPILLFALLFSCICGYLVTIILRRPSDLEKQVAEKTEEIQKSQEFFKSLFEHAGLGITHTNSINGNFIDANEKFCEIIGYTLEEIKTMDFIMITHLEDLEKDLKQMERLRKGEIHGFSMEKRYFHKNGKIIWVNITVSPLWLPSENPSSHMTIVEDITQRKLDNKELFESREKIESLINTIDGIVWESYSYKPGLTFVSKKSEEILGYKSEDWLNDPNFWKNHLHPDDRDWVIAEYEKYSKIKKPHISEYRMIDKYRNTIWVRDLVNVYFENDKSFKFRGILIDITKSKRTETELNNSLSLVTEQNKRLLDFSHIVSHNLRSHTSNIESLIHLIETTEDDSEKNEYIQLLKKVSTDLNDTMTHLNETVSIKTDMNRKLEKLNVNKYLNKTLDILSNQIKSKNAVIKNDIEDNVTLNYNPAYLESILLNFISNALKYSHPERNPIIELKSFEENDYIVIQIKDNGIGIDLKKNGSKLFGMYKTFTNNPESKGIGLFIVKNQVDAMNGKITVESEINKGTVFKIYFKK